MEIEHDVRGRIVPHRKQSEGKPTLIANEAFEVRIEKVSDLNLSTFRSVDDFRKSLDEKILSVSVEVFGDQRMRHIRPLLLCPCERAAHVQHRNTAVSGRLK